MWEAMYLGFSSSIGVSIGSSLNLLAKLFPTVVNERAIFKKAYSLRASVGVMIYWYVHMHFPGAVACQRYRARSIVSVGLMVNLRRCPTSPFGLNETVMRTYGPVVSRLLSGRL